MKNFWVGFEKQAESEEGSKKLRNTAVAVTGLAGLALLGKKLRKAKIVKSRDERIQRGFDNFHEAMYGSLKDSKSINPRFSVKSGRS